MDNSSKHRLIGWWIYTEDGPYDGPYSSEDEAESAADDQHLVDNYTNHYLVFIKESKEFEIERTIKIISHEIAQGSGSSVTPSKKAPARKAKK